ncbi:hypothetical protein FHR24_002256 [Wenyingzhuangia heitensis]|uniref:Glycosyl transferase CAP10 domain-containing protein n=1 Tax=Wenyingzhuangia heitensis TaxID=1487859 RepID=A0ABX0UD32_9FLAO|nr:glycosyl transferase family 90 [Wenyingzhuangia heitensis]NIJ45785.1 hypothetical protein [Wenyingzhuangia heitensis]
MGFTKLKYYVKNTILDILPRTLFKKGTNRSDFNIKNRLDYYNKLESTYKVISGTTIEAFRKPKKLKTYYFDLIEFLRYYSKSNKINYEFGDVVKIPAVPTFVKSRPIKGDNQNSVLMKLNKVRHFKFVKDSINFSDKKNQLIGRAKIFAYHPHRIAFYEKYFHHPLCNLGAVNSPKVTQEWDTPKLSIKEHLQYKFILSLEGNDVATNLKWVMSSNSIAVMPMPTYETWFMEGTLIPNYHFICIKDDYSDLEEKLTYYINNTDEALEIVKNANEYTLQFKDDKLESAISFGVVDKYFELQEV